MDEENHKEFEQEDYKHPVMRNFPDCNEAIIFMIWDFSNITEGKKLYLNQLDILHIETFLRSIEGRVLTDFYIDSDVCSGSVRPGIILRKWLPSACDLPETESGRVKREFSYFWDSIGKFSMYFSIKGESVEEIKGSIECVTKIMETNQLFNEISGLDRYLCPYHINIESLMVHYPWDEEGPRKMMLGGVVLEWVSDEESQDGEEQEEEPTDKYGLGLEDWKREREDDD